MLNNIFTFGDGLFQFESVPVKGLDDALALVDGKVPCLLLHLSDVGLNFFQPLLQKLCVG